MVQSQSPEVTFFPIRQRFTRQSPFIPHAASLHQSFLHCAKFLTAASRRSLDRVSVPVWLIVLSDQLLIVALVSRYLTNKLIRRRLIPIRFLWHIVPHPFLAPISWCYSGDRGRLSTRYSPVRQWLRRAPWLACVRHAASVRPEPGSNSPLCIVWSYFL